MNDEAARLAAADAEQAPWKLWGPYLSERQWGTVREDYSDSGNAWDYFSHDQSRARAYRWGEDGLAGVCDAKQQLCLALALWNGRDELLKERLFGLTNSEGNHGEDVKEYYYYLDSTPTHSYLHQLYKYPQAAFPYAELVQVNRSRSRTEMEYELLDTGVFAEDRYFDVSVEYAKESPTDLVMRVTAHNRGPEAAPLHVLPTLWFRNTWSWSGPAERPELRQRPNAGGALAAEAEHPKLGRYYWYAPAGGELLFTENETNAEKLFRQPNRTPYVKDAFHRYVIEGAREAVHPDRNGTKAAAAYRLEIPAGGSRSVTLRLSTVSPAELGGTYPGGDPLGAHAEEVLALRRTEADDFYANLTPNACTEDEGRVIRQALAGMLWSKQFYYFDLDRWLGERGCDPLSPVHKRAPRNDHWHHMYNADIISMPDKWEYPWYAAWDLAFHVLALTMVDRGFGKHQLELMLQDRYLHPNGQIPAYEWNFGDVNPPVHAWATLFTYNLDRAANGEGDVVWLRRCFDRLLLNFTWWVNRKDREGRNVFEGGFLGLDNIGVFDRSSALPTGGFLEQADGTAWMALYSQNMLMMAAELAKSDPACVDMALKFAQHFLWIAAAMYRPGDNVGMWDEEDGFFYDVLQLPDGGAVRLKVRSMVGLLPLCAVSVYAAPQLAVFEPVAERFQKFLEARPELVTNIHHPRQTGREGRRMLSIVDEGRLRRILARLLDEKEFLSPYGIRSLSRVHAEQPYVFYVNGQEHRVDYLPAESDTGMFGGNSNWRGPIWMPVNALLIRALLTYYEYYGDDFKVECPTGSGNWVTLFDAAAEIGRRLGRLFLRDEGGRRAVFGGAGKFQSDPHWRDHLLFYEYFHGDNGAGLGASHQTGWTGVIARILQLFAVVGPEQLEGPCAKQAIFQALAEPQAESPS